MKKAKNRAEVEFDILEKTVKNAVITPFKKEILALVYKFGISGQSGASAPFISGAISQAVKDLCMQRPICPITGSEEEWNNDDTEYTKFAISEGSEEYAKDIQEAIDTPKTLPSYQNNRLSSVFKKGKAGRPYYLDAIVFKGEGEYNTFTSNNVELSDGTTIGSRQYIKLPFSPKTFYVDVVETEWYKNKDTGKITKQEGGGWWTSVVKDESQLKEVFEYYDRFGASEK